jgi:hypothetical protein
MYTIFRGRDFECNQSQLVWLSWNGSPSINRSWKRDNDTIPSSINESQLERERICMQWTESGKFLAFPSFQALLPNMLSVLVNLISL